MAAGCWGKTVGCVRLLVFDGEIVIKETVCVVVFYGRCPQPTPLHTHTLVLKERNYLLNHSSTQETWVVVGVFTHKDP